MKERTLGLIILTALLCACAQTRTANVPLSYAKLDTGYLNSGIYDLGWIFVWDRTQSTLTPETHLQVPKTLTDIGSIIWLFPALDKRLRVAQYLPAYTSGIDIAYQQGFRSVLMPNLPDLTKTIYYQRTYSRKKLRALRKAFTAFNAQYSTMIKNFRRRHRNTKYATVDVFRLWDGTGTVADGLHPNPSTHGLFALWFWNAVK